MTTLLSFFDVVDGKAQGMNVNHRVRFGTKFCVAQLLLNDNGKAQQRQN
jgi:hypothetical protein